jgi:beta-N-acetylhexosaminidase
VNLVKRLGVAQIQGYQHNQRKTGVGATLKHWPGFGAAQVNSDDGEAISPQTLAQVKRQNLPSFRAGLKAGADRVMVTHLEFPRITGSEITSLSRYWVTKRLRHRLGYHGPVVTDALDASALDAYTPQQIALLAFRAGSDQLLEIAQTPKDPAPADLVTAYPAILNAVQTGAISKKRLHASLRRILTLKWKLGLVQNRFAKASRLPRVVGTSKHRAVAAKVSARAITLLRNTANLLPLRAGTGDDVLVTGFGNLATATVGSGLNARGLDPNVMPTGFNPNQTQIDNAVAAANSSDLVMVNS